MDVYFLVLLAVHGAVTLAAWLDILLHSRRSTAAVAWLFSVATLPLLGVLVYLAFGVYRGPHHIRRLRQRASIVRATRERREGRGEATYRRDFARPGFATLMAKTCTFPLTSANTITLFDSDTEALARQLACIAGAEREVVLSTYILATGEIQRSLFVALAAAARRGVAVRLLVDGFGSYRLTRRSMRQLETSGAETRLFQQPNPLRGRVQINFRNHRKILVVDGQVAFTGGRNWSDHYYSSAPGPTYRDTSFEVRGRALLDMRRVFYEDWTLAGGRPAPPQVEELPGLGTIDGGNVEIRVLPAGLDEPSDDIATVLCAAFRSARHSILIVTPYFVPAPRCYDALRIAALSGVHVRILAPRHSGRLAIDMAAASCFRRLLQVGARIWLRPAPFLHSKAIVVDDAWATVGSVNFDARSTELNFELNLEVVDRTFARRLRSYFDQDFAVASELDASEFERPATITRRLLENIASILAPIL